MAPQLIADPDPQDLAEPVAIPDPDPADLADPVASIPDPDPADLAEDVQTSSPPARGVPGNAPTIGGVPLPDSMLPMTPAAAAEASRAAPVQATPEQRQASFQETAAKTADLRRRIEIAERAGNKEGAQQLIQDLEAVAPGTVARQEKQNAQLRTLTKMGIGGAVAGPAALLTSTIAAPANEAIMSREIDTDLPPSDSLAQYWKYGAQSFRSQVKMVAKKPETVDDWLKFQESAAKLKVAEEKLVPGEGFVRKGLQGLANSAPAMIDTLVQSGGFAPASFKQWADQGTAMILSDALRGKDVRSMSKEQLDEFYYMARGAGALYAGVEFGQSPLALTKALGFDVGGNIAGKVIKMAAENPVFKRKLVQIGMRFAGRTAAEIGEEGLQQPITDLTTDAIKTMAENPDKGKVAATWDNLAAKWWDYTKGSAEAMKQAIIPAAGMILGGKVVETPFRLAAAQEAKKKAAAPGPQPGPEDAEPVRDIEKFKQEWREAELPEDVITKLADNYAKGDKAGEDAIIAEYEASQAAAAREAAKTPATATGVPTTPAQGPAGEGGKAADVATPETTQKDEPIYSQNSTQANVRGPVADAVKAVAAKIPDADVMPTKQGVGREDDPHITLKYGVEDNASESIKGIARAHPPITATLGKMSVFPPSPNSDGAAVVHVEIDSPELHALRKQIDEAAGSRADDFDYKPHITVAYVKPEASAKYEGGTDLEGQKVTLDSIAVTDRNGKQIELKLEGKPDAAAPKIRVDRADGKTQANPPGQSISRDGIRDTAGTEATRPPAPAKGTGVRASPDVQPQEKVKEKASEVVPEKPEVPQREREPASQLQEGRQAADEAPEPRQPDVLSRQAQPAATPTSTAGGVAGPISALISIDRAEQLKKEIGRLRGTVQSLAGTSRSAKMGILVDAERELASITIDEKAAKQNAERSVNVGDIVWTAMNESVQANGRDQDRARNTPFIVTKVNPKTLRVKSQQTDQEFTVYRSATIPFSPESAAKPQDTGREPTITAPGDATREIYPQEFEDRIKAGLNPAAEAENIPDAPIVSVDTLNAAKAAPIHGTKADAIQERVFRGLLLGLATHSPHTADMFYGSGTVTYYLHKIGALKPGHTVSEFEPLRATMVKQLAGKDSAAVASETKKMVRQINAILRGAEKLVENVTTADEMVAAFAAYLHAMPNPSEATADIRAPHEAEIVDKVRDSLNNWYDKFIKDRSIPPGAADIRTAWLNRSRLYSLQFWSNLKFPEFLAPDQDLAAMRKRMQKHDELLEKHPELEAMDEDTPKDATQQWLFDQLQKYTLGEPPKLVNTPEAAGFYMAIQWATGSDVVVATAPGDIGGLRPLFTLLGITAKTQFTDAEIDSLVKKNHEALKDSEPMQADSWPEIPKLAERKPGVLIVADPSYFAKEGESTKNYGPFTEIKKSDQLMKLVDKYLLPAWKKGARIILTNTYEADTVKRLQERGFNVVTFKRKDGSLEFAAYNANPSSGEILPLRPEDRWSERDRAKESRRFEFKPRSEPDAAGGTAGVQTSPKRVEQGAAGETAGRGGVAYPIAGDEVDGRTVRDEIPNLSSISASLDQYEILSGVREVPMSEFDLSGEHYSVEGNKRISELANAISESGEITPLIVVVDKDGPYILEGATRADALFRLKAKSFPALVVIDKSDIQFSKRRKTPRTTEKVKARAALIEGPVDFALSDYPIPYLPRRAKDRTGGTRDPVNTVMSTLRYYAREGTMEQKRIARELLDRWTTESSRSPDEWYEEMSGSNPAVAGTDLGDFMANIVGPEVERIMEGRTLTPSDQFMDKEAEGEAEEAYRAAVEGMEAGSATPDVFKQAPALAEIGTTSEKPYRIVYPEGTVEAYKDADGWHVRTNRLLPFRRVDGTKAGRAMAASLDARLAAAKGETDERSTEGVETRRGRSTAVMHASRPIDSRQPEADTSIGKTTENLGRSQRDAVADDGIPEDGTAQISGPANAPQVETVVDANTAERQSPARRGKRDAGIGNKNKPEAGYERAQRDIARTEEALSIATEHAEENLAALKDAYARFDSRYSRLTVYTPAADDVQWGYAAEFSRILGQELLPVSGLWTNGIRAPKLPGVSVVDAKNDFPIIVTTAHEISHGFDKQYDTGTNDPLTNPALALRKALDAQIGPEQIEGYVNGPGINWRPKWNSTAGNPIGRKLLEQEIRVEMRADFMGEAITQEKFWVKLFDISRKAFDLFSRFVNDIIDRVSVSPRLSVLPYFRDVEAAMDAAAAFYKHVIESKAERTAAASADLPFSAKREPNLFLQAKALEAQPPEGQEQHRFNVHVIDHKDIAPEVRERVAAHYYEVKPKKVTSDNAAAWLMKQGDTALAEAALFNEATDIPADERIASAILLHAKYADRAADEKLTKEERDAALDQMISMGNWIDNHFMQYGQAINQAKLHYHDLSTLRGSVANLQWTRRKANAAELQEVAPLAEAIAEVAEIERVQVEKQAEAIPEDMVAKAIYDEVVKRYRDLEQVNTRLHMRSSSKVLKALVDVIADPVRRNSPSLAEPNKKIEDREAKAMERLKAKMTGIQASEKRDLPGDDIIPEPDRSDLIDLTVGQIRKNGMADVVAFTKWMKDTFGTAYEGKEISSVWYDAVLLYGETVGPYLTGTSKAKHAKAKESIKKDRELQMDLPAQPSPFLGFSSEELSKYRKTELQGIIDQTRLRATGTTQPTAEETAQMDLQARADAPQGDIFPKELFLKAKAQDIIDLTKLSANAKAVFMAATTPDTTMAELYAQAGVPTEGVPYTNIIDTKLADLLTGPVMEKAIREHLRTWNESLARLAMQDATAGETLAGSLAKQLTATFGLTPYKASILEQAIRKKVVRMTDAARQKELKRVLKEKKVAEPRRGHRKAINEVLALANLGALDAQNINQVIAKKLGISTELTTEQVSELDRLSKAIRAANEGTPKNDATREAMRYIARQTGRNWWRVWTAQFYNNIFSAPPTTARNVAGTSINDLQETLVDLSMNPDAVIAMMKGKAKGVIPGFHELLAKLRGKTVQRAADKLEMPNDIEVNWPRAGLFFNFPTNFLTGQDLPFYTSAEHAALATLAFEEAKKTPGIGMAEATRVAMHRIYGSKEEQQAWVDQATTEYPGNSVAAKLDRKRRIHELMLMRLPQEWQTAMKEAGGRHSLNDELDPDSTITEAAKILTQFASRAMPVKFTVAIITMPARLLQRNLDYMGYGLVRAKFGHTQNWNWFTLGHRKPNLETPEQRDIHRRRAIFGIGFSLATNLLAALAAGVFEDDEDKKKKMQKRPWFSLNGPGPKSGEQRSQLRRTGWFPWSIGVQLPGSDKIRYYPMGLAGTMTLNLMMSGFVWDAIRYKSLKDTSATGWITATGLMGIRGMAEMSPIRNATRMLDAITAENTETAINQMTRQLAGTFDAMIVPYSAGVNWITKMIDPVNYESGSFVVELLKKTPAAAMVGKPAIDDLGYVVKGMYPVLWSTEKTDTAGKVWKLIVDNEAWIPRVGRPMITDQEFPAGRPITDEERYLMIKIRGQLLAREIEQNMSTYESKTQAEFQEAVDEKLSEYYDQAKTAIQRAAKDPSYDPEEVLK